MTNKIFLARTCDLNFVYYILNRILMASSQEKISEKYFHIIEKAIQDTVANENTKTLLREFMDFLLDELNTQKENENTLQENLENLTSIEDSTLETKCLNLEEKVTDCEKYLDHLKDEIDNINIQSIADKETLKIEKAEKEQNIISFYEAEVRQLRQQLENNKKEHNKTEQEIKNKITLELGTKNMRLGEIKGNLQKQIVEKNSILIKMQSEHKELRKELSMLKPQEKTNTAQYKKKKTNPGSNVMEFYNDNLVQKNQTNSSNDPNKCINVYPPRTASVMSEYSTTEQENQDYVKFANSFMDSISNNFGQRNSAFNKTSTKSNNKPTYITNTTNDKQLLNNDPPINSAAISKDQTNKNTVRGKEFTNEDISYFAVTKPIAQNDKANAQFLDMVPNPCSFVNKAGSGSLTQNKRTTNKKNKIKIAKSPKLKPLISSQHNDSQMIEDPDMFDEDLIKNCKSLDYDSNPLDVPRNGPTLYMCETKKRKMCRKVDGTEFGEHNENKGMSLNNISELHAKKWK